MGDDITIGVTEIVNNIEVTAQPNDQVVDINVVDNTDEVTLNITPTVVEININKGSSYARWGTIYGNLTDQTDLTNALILKADLVDGKVPAYQLPSFVDDVVEVANYAALPAMGEIGKIYVTLDNNKIYRWSGSIYIEIASNNAIWGAITGTLSNQTDLQNALDLKQNSLSWMSPLSVAGGTVSISYSGVSTNGALSSTDWNTFNGKANDNAVVHLTGAETITGQKTFNNSSNSISIYSNNTSVGTGIYSDNSGIGTGIQSINSSSGLGFYSQNTSTGKGIQSNNTSTGYGINSNNSSTGIGFYSNNTTNGTGIYSNNTPSGTGIGIYSNNTGGGTGFYSNNISSGIGFNSNNSSTGKGFESTNSSTGQGFYSLNSGLGTGIYSSNSAAGKGIESYNSSTGIGFYSGNTGTGTALYLNNQSSGKNLVLMNTTSATGMPFTIQKQGLDVFTINDAGEATANSFINVNASSGIGFNSTNNSTGKGIQSVNSGSGTGIYSSNSSTGDGIFVANSSTGRGVVLTNTSTGSGIFTSNTGAGTGIVSSNTSTGKGILLDNSSTGTGIYLTNSSTGTGIRTINSSSSSGIYATNSSIGEAIRCDNSSTGIAIYSNNSSSGRNLVLNNTATATGIPFTVKKDGTDVFTINDAGGVYAAGSVGIGTTSPSSKLTINGRTDFWSSGYGWIHFDSSSTNQYLASIKGSDTFMLTTGKNGANTQPALLFGTSDVERMRITSAGDVLVGRSSLPAAFGDSKGLTMRQSGAVLAVADDDISGLFSRRNTDGSVVLFRRDSTTVGSIGVTTTLTSYNVTSDYRLKQDFKPFNGLDLVSKIKVYDYAWKADNSRMNGVIAHELQEVVPYAVTGEKDGDAMQQVDYSKLVPILVQAIQELQEKINKLENK